MAHLGTTPTLDGKLLEAEWYYLKRLDRLDIPLENPGNLGARFKDRLQAFSQNYPVGQRSPWVSRQQMLHLLGFDDENAEVSFTLSVLYRDTTTTDETIEQARQSVKRRHRAALGWLFEQRAVEVWAGIGDKAEPASWWLIQELHSRKSSAPARPDAPTPGGEQQKGRPGAPRNTGRTRLEDDPVARELYDEGERLRLKHPGITRPQIAGRLGLSKSTYKRYVRCFMPRP